MNGKFKLTLLFLLFVGYSLTAQVTPDDAREDLDYYSQDRSGQSYGAGGLWYGGGFQLGFSSSNFESLFIIGLSPMVGYKVTPAFSIGPRGSILFNSYGVGNAGNRQNASYLTYAAGIFARMKAFQQFFAQVEYNLENDVIGFNNTTDLTPIRRTRGLPYVGAGFSQGGGFEGGVGFEIAIMFRVVEREFINEAPYVIRSGINVNF